jgi:hypothetical protein
VVADSLASVPIENIKGASSIVEESGIHTILACPAYEFKFQWYLGKAVRFLRLSELSHAFCSDPAPLIYLAYPYGTAPHYPNLPIRTA